ncbi:MAG: hypothetical protein IJH07_01170 [Ruminococcus sp.]|nr:hypothetical protein [Ruminococcus sp.]
MIIFSMIVLIFFAIIGLCAFIASIIDICGKSEGRAELILHDLTPDDAELRIREAARICQAHRGYILKCACSENDPAYDICTLMQKDYPFIQIIPPDNS